MAEVKFINLPPGGIYSLLDSPEKRKLQFSEPLGLLYLASYLRERGIEIDFLDLNTMGDIKSIDSLVSGIIGDTPIIAMPVYSALLEETLILAEKIKESDDNIQIVVGGPHATFEDETLLQTGNIDFVVRKEGDETLYDLVNSILMGKKDYRQILGLSFKEGENIIRNPDRPFILDINTLPFPARDLLSPDYYQLGGRMAMVSGRGCPSSCIFCVSPNYWNKKLRLRSPENIESEIKTFLEKNRMILPSNFKINFVDDNFTLGNKKRIQELVTRISQYKIPYDIYSRVDTFNEEIAHMLSYSGANIVRFGLESGNQRILSLIKKGQTLDQIKNAVSLAKKVGLKTQGSFVIGFPTETENEIYETIKFSKELPLDYAFYFIATPYPGTDLFKNFVSSGKNIKYKEFEKFNATSNLFGDDERLIPQRKVELLAEAYHSFYTSRGVEIPKGYHSLSNPLEKVTFLQEVILDKYFNKNLK